MSSITIPQTHRALVVDPSAPNTVGVSVINDRPTPKLGDDQIMIKVKAIALNPTDFKHIVRNALHSGDALGCDFAGDIIAIGATANVATGPIGSDGLKIGDAVAGFIRGGMPPDNHNGSFQEHVVTLPQLVWRIPKDGSVPYEDAASMGGIALSTAAYALYYHLKLPKPWEPTSEPFPVVIWAGSTSVGMYAIKLAKLSNLTVATTASPKNHAHLRSIGADAVYDYNDPSTPAKIRKWSGNQIIHAFDPISDYGSTLMIAKSMSDERPGMVNSFINVQKKEGDGLPDNINFPPRLDIYDTLLRENEQKFNDLIEWNRYLSNNPDAAVSLKVVPLTRLPGPGGLDGIGEGLDYLYAGKVSAEKLVYTL